MSARILLNLIVGLTIFRNAATCGDNDRFGIENPNTKHHSLDTNTGYGYMMRDATYIVNCCGVIDSWVANFDGVTGSRTIYFQVWRAAGASSYELIGQNSLTTSSDGEQTLSVAVSDRITIQSGDLWGWWTAGTDIITYRSSVGEANSNYYMALGSTTVGGVVNWSTETLVNDRTYGIRVNVQSNDVPFFTNLASTVTIAASTASGTSLYTVSVDDVNTDDVSTLSVSMTTFTSKYSFDTSSHIVTLASTLSGVSATDTLSFEVVDQCSNTATATLTVSITNQPPAITSLPASNSIVEDETVETLLHTLVTTDPEGSHVTCTMAASVPSAYPFTVKQIPSSSSYGIYSDSNPGFNYTAQNSYSLTIDCTDGEYTDSGVFTASIVKNVAPTFSNLQSIKNKQFIESLEWSDKNGRVYDLAPTVRFLNSTSVTTSSAIGANAFTVSVYDPEGDDLSFSMTCDPTPCPFVIFDSGEIQINEDLSTHTTVGYDLFITVSDGRNTVGPSTLTITIADLNNNVTIDNLPVTKVVVENTVAGTTVYDVDYTDLDTSQAHSFSMTSSPSSGLSYFSIDTTSGLISVQTSPDYDVLGGSYTYVLTVVVNDPVSSDTGTVTIEITNVNEAPSFSQSGYTLSTIESSAGTIIGTPAFGITDPDVGDSYTLSLDCGTETGYFSIDPSSGQVSFQSNYDLDTGSLPTTVTCTVTVTDAGGLTNTASLTISIDYINDNTPVFSPASYTLYVSYYAAIGTTVGTVTVTDADAGGHGVLTLTLNQTSLSNEYFAIDNTGTLTVKTSLSPLGYASTVTIFATASDVGALSDTATIVIAISDTTTTSTTTTTISYKSFFDDTRNIAWFVVCIIVLICSLIFLGYIIFTCNGANGCTSFVRNCRGSWGQRKIRKWSPRRHSSGFISTITEQSVRNPPPRFHSWKKFSA